MGVREILHPVGPLPASVYWLRRGAVGLLVAFVVVIVVLVAIPHGSATRPASSPAPSTPVAVPTSATTAASSPTGSASPTTSASVSESAAALPACAPSALRVAVTTSARTYAAGSDPRFTATLTTTGAACTAAGPLTLEITSGSDRIWGSADCAATSGASTDLGTGGSQGAARSWNRVRTVPGCGKVSGSSAAEAGTYKVTATWAGVTSDAAAFSLR